MLVWLLWYCPVDLTFEFLTCTICTTTLISSSFITTPMGMYSQSSFLVNKTLFGFTVELFVNLFFFCFFLISFEVINFLRHSSSVKVLSFFQVKNRLPLPFHFLFGKSFQNNLFFFVFPFFSLFSLKHQFYHTYASLEKINERSITEKKEKLQIWFLSSFNRSVVASVSKDVSSYKNRVFIWENCAYSLQSKYIFFHVKTVKYI